MPSVQLYTTAFCPYCERAKALFRQKGVAYEEHNLDHLNDEELHEQMKKLSGQRTVPQIVINETPIGGWRELSDLDRTGDLDRMLKE